MKSRISIYTLLTLTALGSTTMLQAQETTPKADPKTEKPAKVDPPKEIALDGELRLDGKLTVLLGTGQWVVEAVSWTSPKGVTTNFDDPRNKTVILNPDAFLHPHAEFDKVPLAEITVGSHVAIIGKNQPDGTVKVREVVLLEGYGSHKMVGVFNTNRETGQLVDQSRAARDAGQISRAIDLAKRGVEIAQGMGDGTGEALAVNDLGNLYLENDQMEQAMDAYTREETLGKMLSSPLALTFAMLGKASVLASSDHVPEAIEVLLAADPISLNAPITLHIDVMAMLSRAYAHEGQTSDALGVMAKLYPLQAANGQLDNSYRTRATMALLQASDEPEAARAILDQIAPNVPNINNDVTRANTMGMMGLALWRIGEKDAANEQFQKASKTLNDAGKKGADRWGAIAKKLAEAGDKADNTFDVLNGNDGDDTTTQDQNTNQNNQKTDAPPNGPTA